MRTTIYIPDDLVDEIKEAAWREKISVSGYLIGLHKESSLSPIKMEGDNVPDYKKSKPAERLFGDPPEIIKSYSKAKQLGKEK